MRRRVLVSGSRDWPKREIVNSELTLIRYEIFRQEFTLVHGDCPTGADKFADNWGKIHLGEYLIERHPAEWDRYGKAAGPRRNKTMVMSLNPKWDFAIIFIYNKSKGATNTFELVKDAGIDHTLWTLEKSKYVV